MLNDLLSLRHAFRERRRYDAQIAELERLNAIEFERPEVDLPASEPVTRSRDSRQTRSARRL